MPTTASSLISAVILTGILALMWRNYRERWLGLWALAGGLWVVRYLLAIAAQDQSYHAGAHLLPALTIGRGWFLILGAYDLSQRKMPRAWRVLFVLDLLWLLREWLLGEVLIAGARGVTHYLLFGGATIFAAAIIVARRREYGPPALVVGGGLLVIGLVNSAFPWAFPVRANRPWMLLAVHGAQLFVGVGALMLFFRRENVERDATLARLEQALARALSGHLRICAHCKAIEDGARGWEPLEKYFQHRHEAAFSHGICPSCEQLHYGDLASQLSMIPQLPAR